MIDINKKYKTRSGCEVRIYATDGGGDYPIHGAILRDTCWCVRGWMKNGEYVNPIDSHDMDLIEVSPYEDFKIDEKVLVWNGDKPKKKRYFAGVAENGRPLTFKDGATSWSTNLEPIDWNYCERWRGE